MRVRGLLALGASLAAAWVLSGCLVISSQTAEQLDVIGDVRVTTTICASDSDASDYAGCPGQGNQPADAEPGVYQVLIAYRVPAGSTARSSPVTISTGPTGGGSLAFSASATYTAQLELLEPAGAGRRWIGYLSEPFDYSPAGPSDHEITLATSFSLPAGSGPNPFAGPFNYRTVVGYREVSASLPADRPVQCGEPLVQTGETSTNCVSSPDAGTLDSDIALPTRDLKLTTEPPIMVLRGQTANLSFGLRFAGLASPEADFALSAQTTMAGASAVPALASWKPADGESAVTTVGLSVPADAAGGIYELRLSASLPNGQKRSVARQVKIAFPAAPLPPPAPAIAPPPADLTPPILAGLTVTPKRFVPTSRGVASTSVGSNFKIATDEAATVELTLYKIFRGRRISSRCVKSTRRNRRASRCSKLIKMGELMRHNASAGENLVPFDGWFAGRRLKPSGYRIFAVAVDQAGNRSAARATSFTIVERRKAGKRR